MAMFPDWNERVSKEEAQNIINKGQHIGDGCFVKDCFWRGYDFEGRFFIGLCDSNSIWEVDKQTMLDHCIEP